WAAREIALRWLPLVGTYSAVEMLVEALRLPHARVRLLALELLLEDAPQDLTEGVVLWLLEDAARHPLPERLQGSSAVSGHDYEEALIRALRLRQPAEGW